MASVSVGLTWRAARGQAQAVMLANKNLIRQVQFKSPLHLASARSLSPLYQLGSRGFRSSAIRHELFLGANAETFRKAVSPENTKDKVVLVDFYADWCPPCRILSPILEKLAEDPSIRTSKGHPIDLVTVNSDEEPELAAEYKITSLPTVIAFANGERVNGFIGAIREDGVREFISKL